MLTVGIAWNKCKIYYRLNTTVIDNTPFFKFWMIVESYFISIEFLSIRNWYESDSNFQAIKITVRTLYHDSFFVVGPVLWNSLPSKLNSIQVMSTFKNQLDILLNTLPDNPPVTGYMRTHTNYLPEVLSLSRRNERIEV